MATVIGATTEPLQRPGMSVEEKFVVFASSLGTVFEWYDFFLYAVLAPFFASLFFPPGNDTAALLSAFATYAAGFLVRPFGAMVFGRVGDLIGRKYTFLVTIMMMGAATFSTGLLPTFPTIGWSAPILLVTLRLIQGIAIGGEYGGAAIYVAEHARPFRRGYATSFINTTGTAGLALALVVIIGCREFMEAKAFADWGWRIPFIVSAILLVFSIYIRLRLNETPIFLKMKAEGAHSKAPLTESFLRYPNNKFALLALLGNCAGVSVVWYTAHFYALFFLTITLKMSYLPAYLLILISLIVASPGFVLFGWLSDRIGRLKIILTGCVVAALTYFPLFSALTHYVNPDLEAFTQRTPIVLSVDESTCHMHIFVTAFTKFSTCDRAKDFVTKLGVSFKRESAAAGEMVTLSIGSSRIDGFDSTRWNEAFLAAGYPNLQKNKDGAIVAKPADPAKINWPMAELILVLMVGYVTMVYGPQAAQLVELFPARIRYTSLSLPYHIGAGWFGGMLPLLATALVSAYGDIYVGLWYPISTALMTAIVGTLFLGGRKDVDIAVESRMESAVRI
jgi:MFS family permease